MPVESADLRELLEKVEAREEQARRELAEADSQAERSEIRERIEALEKRNAELEAQLAERSTPEPEPEPAEPEPDDDDEEAKKPKMRRGRKRGQVYQDAKGEPGYVYQGDDEPDLVPVEEASG